MDTSFVWILMLAGAAVVLLGLVLLASERELKAKRRQIEELLAKLESLVTAGGAGLSQPQPNRAPGLSEDKAQDQEQRQDNHDRLQGDISALKRTLEASEAKVRDLEAAQRKVADLETVETQHRHERQSLHERIAELEGRLLGDQGKLSELQSMSDRLAEAESAQASLHEEIRRREAEIFGWQARMAAAEEQGQRVAALQRPCNELLSKQAALIEAQRRLQEELAAFARLLAQAQPVQSPDSVSDGASSAGNAAPEDVGASREAVGHAARDNEAKQK